MIEQETEQTHAAKLGRPKKIDEMPVVRTKVEEPAKHIDKTVDYKKQRENEEIRGRFNYITKPGATLQFNAYLDIGDSEKHIKITDGEIKPLKRKVARHLNQTGKIKVYKNVIDANGCEQSVFSHEIKRWYFENFDFFELDDIAA